MSLYWKILSVIDDEIIKAKNRYINRIYTLFMEKYSLVDGIEKKRTGVKYNPYEGSNPFVISALIESGAIKTDDVIMDIGCGVGLFLIFLHSKGFYNLYGIEMDDELYRIATDNIANYKKKYAEVEIIIQKGNVLLEDIPDDVNIFYFYNPFFDSETYFECFNKIKESLLRKARKIKLIFLYPTVSVSVAIEKSDWLKKLWRIHKEGYPCSKCIHFLVYENIIESEGNK